MPVSCYASVYLPNLTRHMVMKHNSVFYKYFYKTFEVCSFNVYLKAEVYNGWFEHAVVPRNKQAFAHEAILALYNIAIHSHINAAGANNSGLQMSVQIFITD